MAKHHKLELTESEIQALVDLRDKGETGLSARTCDGTVENPSRFFAA